MHKKVNPTSFRQFQLNKKGLRHNFAIDINTNNRNYFFRENLYLTFWLQNEMKKMKFLPLKIEIRRTQKVCPTINVNIVLFNKIIFKIYFLFKFFKKLILKFFKKKVFFMHLKKLNAFLRQRKLKRKKVSYKKSGRFIWPRTIRLVQRRTIGWEQIFQSAKIIMKNYRRIFLSNFFFLKTIFFFNSEQNNFFFKNVFYKYYFLNFFYFYKNKFDFSLMAEENCFNAVKNVKIFLILVRSYLSSLFTTRIIKLKSFVELKIRSLLKTDADVNLFIAQPNTVVSSQLINYNSNRFAKKRKGVLHNKEFPSKKEESIFFSKFSLSLLKQKYYTFKKQKYFLKHYFINNYTKTFFKQFSSRLKIKKSSLTHLMFYNFLRKFLLLHISSSKNINTDCSINIFKQKFSILLTELLSQSSSNKKTFCLKDRLQHISGYIVYPYTFSKTALFLQKIGLHNYRAFLSKKLLVSELNHNNMLKLTLSHKNPRKYGHKFDPTLYRRYRTFKAQGFFFLRNHIKLMVYGIYTGNVDLFNEAFCYSFKKIKKHRHFFSNLRLKLNDMLYIANIKNSLIGLYIRIRGKHDRQERRSTFWIRIGEPLYAHNDKQIITYNSKAITTRIGVFGVSTWFVFNNFSNAYAYSNKI